jgi:phospholipase C
MVSPWTRGGRVFTERADHNSQILFLEEWLEARGHKEIRTDQMVRWRREHMSNLVNALDFDNVRFPVPSYLFYPTDRYSPTSPSPTSQKLNIP